MGFGEPTTYKINVSEVEAKVLHFVQTPGTWSGARQVKHL